MGALSKSMGGLFLIALLLAHLLLISLFLAPMPKLLGLVIKDDAGFLNSSAIPVSVETFLTGNKVEVLGDYEIYHDLKSQLILGILKIRKARFMTASEQLALDMNLLNYGAGIIGMGAASEYYFKKSLSELSDKEWINLINLQKIFAKK